MTTSIKFRKAFLFPILAIGFILLWFPLQSLAAPITIDDFDAPPVQQHVLLCCSDMADSAVANAGSLGGERDIETILLAGTSGVQVVVADDSLGTLEHYQSASVTGTTSIVWDGVDNDATTLDPTGLGGVDFTDSGSNTGLLIQVQSASGTGDLVFTAYTDGANVSTATLSLSGNTANQSFFIPFSSFTAGADFANIGAFEMFIDGSISPGFQVTLDKLTLSNFDFGDLPASYNLTTLADDGARHIVGDLYLGSAIDVEADGQESIDADGDDVNGIDDEDGIVTVGNWVTGVNGGSIEATASAAGCLSGWVDWDNNSDFDDVGDDVIVMTEIVSGTNLITFDIPVGTVLTNTAFFGRFRLVADTGTTADCSDDTPIGTTGQIGNGEVEDHKLEPVNDNAPVAVNDVYTTTEDITLNIAATGVLSNDFDIDMDPITATLNTGPANGSVNLNLDGSFTYTPTADFNGADSFTYFANDNNGNTSNSATVTINVTPVNDPLTAVDDTATTNEDTLVSIDVLLNDIDVDGDANVVTITLPANGTAVINSNNVDYTPAAEFSGTDVLDYTITDGVFTDTATITVTVTAVNDPPTAVDDADTTAEDNSVVTDVLANDSDIDGTIDPTTLSIASGPGNGAAIPDPTNGIITYTPSLDFNGADSYDYEICDDGSPLPSACATATVVITVTAVNDLPIAIDDTVTILEDTSTDIDVLANDINVDPSDTLTVTAVTQPGNGTTTLNPDSTVTYSPTLNFNGTDVFSYTMTDGFDSDTAVVTVTVTNVNDVPVVTLSVVTTPTLEGTPIQFNGTVIDPGYLVNNSGGGSSLWDFGDGTIVTNTLTPTHIYPDNGTFTVTLTVTDTAGASDTDFAVVEVANVAPSVSAGADQTITLGDVASFSGIFADPGTDDTHFIEWDFGDGNSIFNTLAPDYTYTAPGTYTVTLTVRDDDNGMGIDQLIINVLQPGDLQTYAYLPIIFNNSLQAPDLEIQLITVTADNVTIVIENSGNQAVSDGFWVDLYINPNPVPTAANQTWEQLSDEGLVWGITDVDALVPGGTLIIDLNHASFNAALSNFSGTFSNGMEVYVQVDSANAARESGGVQETHEITNGLYNNIEHVTVSLSP